MQYNDKTVQIRWGGESIELGTVACPQGKGVEADERFLAEAVHKVHSCFREFAAQMPAQAKFLLTVRALVAAYSGMRHHLSLENRLATSFMKLYWKDWCQMMDPDGRLGTPPPPPIAAGN